MTTRTTQPRSSKGPLGGRGRRLQERLGVVPLAAITRRGAVPVWLRASWSNPAVAAKAASQLANCRRHQGWSRSPSPCTRWGPRSLICARFQPDWGKPNVRLIGGREETDASRLARAAHGASRLPDQISRSCCRALRPRSARACLGRLILPVAGTSGIAPAEQQSEQALCLSIVVNAMIVWNTVYTQDALNQLRGAGELITTSEIEHISPLARKHIHLHGHYPFNLTARPDGHRPLRTPAANARKTPNRV